MITTTGTQLIARERFRQVAEEGYDTDHDDAQVHGELSIAAACYAVEGTDAMAKVVGGPNHFMDEDAWPFSDAWDKRSKHDRLRCLVIAGALIAAEIDRELRRLDREATERLKAMRALRSHVGEGELNAALTIEVLDEAGAGGACHKYRIVHLTPPEAPEIQTSFVVPVDFQKGPIQEKGVNGISNEALLAIVQDRLAGFQSGEFGCEENRLALEHVSAAMMWLHARTRGRVARGVEGTSQP